MQIPLRLGPLKAEGYNIHCSGVRWLCEPGQVCVANQPIAYFNLNLEPSGAQAGRTPQFVDERHLQVVCAPRVGGRLMYDSAATLGGYLSILGINLWDADAVLANLEIDGAAVPSGVDAERLRLMGLAGRRMTQLVDVHAGLLPGWNSRSRGWWCEEGETPVTLLGLGVCDITGAIVGEKGAFLEMFCAEPAPSHFVFIPDHPITPAAPVLLDQLERTRSQFQAMSAELRTYLSKTNATPVPDDWTFAGIMLSMIERCPIRDTYDIMTASGIMRTKPADVVLLSLLAEPPAILRHRTLGYRLHVMRHHQTAAGPAIVNWLSNAFEAVPRTTDDIKADYIKLIDAIEKSTGARVVILNRMSTSGDEDISSYSAFDAPLSGTLANIASKELNLMLHDVAAGRNVGIVDVDAIAADIGGGEHLPDGIHQSSTMQGLLREEILHFMKDLRPEKRAASLQPQEASP